MRGDLSDNFINFEIEESPNHTIISDDHRESYQFLRENTPKDSKILAHWDIGYQIQQIGKRATLLDGNTNNFTHISVVGLIFISDEYEAWKICRSLDVDYVLVTFGGASGFQNDDIMKIMWSIDSVSDHFINVSLNDFITNETIYLVSEPMKENIFNSTFFKLCYNKFRRFWWSKTLQEGFDASRNFKISHLNYELTYFELLSVLTVP